MLTRPITDSWTDYHTVCLIEPSVLEGGPGHYLIKGNIGDLVEQDNVDEPTPQVIKVLRMEGKAGAIIGVDENGAAWVQYHSTLRSLMDSWAVLPPNSKRLIRGSSAV